MKKIIYLISSIILLFTITSCGEKPLKVDYKVSDYENSLSLEEFLDVNYLIYEFYNSHDISDFVTEAQILSWKVSDDSLPVDYHENLITVYHQIDFDSKIVDIEASEEKRVGRKVDSYDREYLRGKELYHVHFQEIDNKMELIDVLRAKYYNTRFKSFQEKVTDIRISSFNSLTSLENKEGSRCYLDSNVYTIVNNDDLCQVVITDDNLKFYSIVHDGDRVVEEYHKLSYEELDLKVLDKRGLQFDEVNPFDKGLKNTLIKGLAI